MKYTELNYYKKMYYFTKINCANFDEIREKFDNRTCNKRENEGVYRKAF